MDHEPGPVRGDCTVAFRREVALVQTILSALAPIVFTLLLGFVAAWRHDFGPKEASVLNRMVLLYAVPLALFVGTVGTPRADLVQDITLVVALFAAIVGLYALVFLLFHFVFRFSLSESVLAALTASAPAVPFMGPAILGDLFGKASAVTIAIAALIINLIVVPITILGLALGRTPIGTPAPSTTRHSVFAEKLLETVKEPIVWAPLLAFVLVLCNVRIPSIVDHGLSLLGQATGGVACRAQVTDFGANGPCTLIGGGKANPIYAAFWHTALVRYVDFMDNFL